MTCAAASACCAMITTPACQDHASCDLGPARIKYFYDCQCLLMLIGCAGVGCCCLGGDRFQTATVWHEALQFVRSSLIVLNTPGSLRSFVSAGLQRDDDGVGGALRHLRARVPECCTSGCVARTDNCSSGAPACQQQSGLRLRGSAARSALVLVPCVALDALHDTFSNLRGTASPPQQHNASELDRVCRTLEPCVGCHHMSIFEEPLVRKFRHDSPQSPTRQSRSFAAHQHDAHAAVVVLPA